MNKTFKDSQEIVKCFLEKIMKNSLRFYRKKAGLTLAALSERTGIAASTIGNVETGRFEPGEDFIKKTCEILKISRQEFLEPSFIYGKIEEKSTDEEAILERQIAAKLSAGPAGAAAEMTEAELLANIRQWTEQCEKADPRLKWGYAEIIFALANELLQRCRLPKKSLDAQAKK